MTGGAGFIGSHIVGALLERGADVRVIDDFSTGNRENLRSYEDDIEIHEIDIRGRDGLEMALEGVDQIYHQAAMPSVPRSMEDPVGTTEITLMGTVQLFACAEEAGVQRIVFASSSSVYGENPELPKVETMETLPASPYAASKRSVEIFGRVFSHQFNLDTVGLRYFNVFGPRQDPDSDYAAVIPAFITALLNGESPTIYGDGEQSRDFTYVQDVVSANLAAMESGDPGESYNVGYDDQTTINELFVILRDIVDVDVEPIYDDPRPGDVRHSRADAEAFKSDTGFVPDHTVREGLKKTVEWYQKHSDTDE